MFIEETVLFEIPQNVVDAEFKSVKKSFEQDLIADLFIPEYIKSCLKQEK